MPARRMLPAVATVESALELGNGRLARSKPGEFEVFQQDIAEALAEADTGKLARAARIWRYCQSDATLQGMLTTRSAGLVALAKSFHGDQEFCDWLQRGFAGDPSGNDDPRATIDLVCPASELRKLAEDGVGVGYGVGCLTPVEGLDFPVLSRLDPECVEYRQYDNTWIFNSAAGPIPIEPGDGYWVLYLPGGRTEPWRSGIMSAVASSVIRKQHSQLLLDSWLRRFSHPARVAKTQSGNSEAQLDDIHQAMIDWSETSIVLPPGIDLSLIAASAEGAKLFLDIVAAMNLEISTAVAGQTVTLQGGKAFASSAIHEAIRADLIRADGAALGECISSQILPAVLYSKFGDAALERYAFVAWQTDPPKDRAQEAQALLTGANAISVITGRPLAEQQAIDVRALCRRFDIPLAPPGTPVLTLVVDNTAPPAVSQTNAADAENENALELDATEPTADEPKAADTALNGAQVTSLLEVIGQVVAGLLPRATAVQILCKAFNMSEADADALLGDVGRTFVPTTQIDPVAPAADAAE